jgi:IPT/TIG domain/PASTA domain
MGTRSRLCPFLIAIAAAAAVPTAAQAQVTLGELSPPSPTAGCTGPKFELAPSQAFGSKYEVRADGVITSWSTNAAPGAGQELTLKVLRLAEGRYVVVGHDGPRPLSPGATNTFKTAIRVRSGDLLGLNTANDSVSTACVFGGGTSDGVDVSQAGTDVADGSAWTIGQILPERRLNVQATLLEPPKISSIGTDPHGSVTGGTPVTIAGENLAEIQSVTFADVPATRITASSENQITVLAPPVNALTDATVVVNTVAGRATALQSFTYEGCDVPNLVHKRLSEAKRRLKSRDCALGRVKRLRGRGSKGPKVIRQSPKAGGALLAPGSKVNLTVVG